MENKKVRVEFPSCGEVVQGAMGELSRSVCDHKAELAQLQDEVDKLEHRALHRKILMETSLSGPENSQGVFGDADRSEIQIMLLREEGFSEFDNSLVLSDEFSSDGEYEGPTGLPCVMCKHLLFTNFRLARSHQAQLERILAEPGQQGLSERTQLHVKGCCLGFYAGLVVVTGK